MKHQLRTVASGLLLAALLAVAESGQAQTQAQGPPQAPALDVALILERYEAATAPTAAELSTLAAAAADGRLLATLRTAGWDWMQAGGPAGIRGRRLTLAALVLEAVSAQRDTSGVVSVPVIEWACANLRESDPLPAERTWQIATVGLMLAAASRSALEAHLAHASPRFKDEPQLLFADALLQRSWIPDGFQHNNMVSTNPYFPNGPLMPVGPIANAPVLLFFPNRTAAEWAAVGMDPSLPGFTGGNVVDTPHGGGMAIAGSVGMVTQDLRLLPPSAIEIRLLAAKNDYQRARGTKAVAAEAELRLGQLDLLYANPKNAFDHFTAALERTSDLNLHYLAYYLIGQSEEQQAQWSAACFYYHKALDANPNGRTVIEAWAGALDKMGLSADALAMRARVTDPAAADPWDAFSTGALGPAAPLIEQLRKAVW
jgi:hypothetical protein